mmetsp:Transcript_34262/g.102674  ORF Transcript_34262/g.102674 Transcript_34262/m.102674 type:complete len:246 (+) Transcript_34262:1455-2192(+)
MLNISVRGWCTTAATECPAPARSFSVTMRFCAEVLSRPEVGSSSRSTDGLATNSTATDTLFLSPPLMPLVVDDPTTGPASAALPTRECLTPTNPNRSSVSSTTLRTSSIVVVVVVVVVVVAVVVRSSPSIAAATLLLPLQGYRNLVLRDDDATSVSAGMKCGGRHDAMIPHILGDFETEESPGGRFDDDDGRGGAGLLLSLLLLDFGGGDGVVKPTGPGFVAVGFDLDLVALDDSVVVLGHANCL